MHSISSASVGALQVKFPMPILILHFINSNNKSLINTKYRIPDKTFPCQTPSVTLKCFDLHHSRLNFNDLNKGRVKKILHLYSI